MIETDDASRGFITIEEYRVVHAIIDVTGPDGVTQQYIWSIGGQNQIRFRFRQPGLYTITITQTDESGYTNVSSYTREFASHNCYSLLIRLGGIITVTVADETSLGEMVIE